MCMAIPARIARVDGETGVAEVAGAPRTIDLRLVPDVSPGDWVLVAFGAALEILDEQTALETIDVLNEFARYSFGEPSKN